MLNPQIRRSRETAILAAPDRSKRDAETRLENRRLGGDRRNEPMIVDDVSQLDSGDEIRIVGEIKQLVQHEVVPSIERDDDGTFRASRLSPVFLDLRRRLPAPADLSFDESVNDGAVVVSEPLGEALPRRRRLERPAREAHRIERRSCPSGLGQRIRGFIRGRDQADPATHGQQAAPLLKETRVEGVIAEIAAHRLDYVVSRPSRGIAKGDGGSSIIDEMEAHARLADGPAHYESSDALYSSRRFDVRPCPVERSRRFAEMVYEERCRRRVMDETFEKPLRADEIFSDELRELRRAARLRRLQIDPQRFAGPNVQPNLHIAARPVPPGRKKPVYEIARDSIASGDVVSRIKRQRRQERDASGARDGEGKIPSADRPARHGKEILVDDNPIDGKARS